jgi:hypothetical protein
MRVKIDGCLPREIVELLAEMDCEAVTVVDENLAGSPVLLM